MSTCNVLATVLKTSGVNVEVRVLAYKKLNSLMKVL